MAVAILVSFCANVLASYDLRAERRKVLTKWLSERPKYRLATDEDCECASSIAEMRNGYGGLVKPVPKYHPYTVSGDFNGDGAEDFAVVLIDRSQNNTARFMLAVFNGPVCRASRPAFVRTGFDLRGEGLFFYDDDASLKPCRLVMGAFSSEGQTLQPQGRTYALTTPRPSEK